MYSEKSDLLAEIMLLVFRVNDSLLRQGDEKVAHLGLTSARWQILAAVALAPVPRSAPQLARRLGVSRQGAQKQLNLLLQDGLLEAIANPNNRRSPFYRLTDKGEELHLETLALRRDWAAELAEPLDETQLDSTRRLLKKLAQNLEAP